MRNTILYLIAKITGHAYVPHRGDVIIFNKNDLFQYDGGNQKKQLVKRVIGLPGDEIHYNFLPLPWWNR